MENKALVKRVEELLFEIEMNRRYSMSKITELHNEVFGLTNTPSASPSILIARKWRLERWLKTQLNSDDKQE